MPITVSSLYIYPVKGLKGIEVAEARCTDRGFADDRRFMVATPGGRFLTQRSHPRMATIWTELVGDALELSAPDQSPVQVPLRPAGGDAFRVEVWQSTVDAVAVSREADAWLSEALGTACRLAYMPDAAVRFSSVEYAGPGKRVSFADGYAYLMIGAASLRDLNARLGAQLHAPLPMNRFRPGIVVDGAEPYAEDGWGRTAIGGAVLRGVKPCGRCEVTTTDQATGDVRGPEPLATLATYRSSDAFGVMFGMNFVTESEGRIAVGDQVVPERG